ncbi:MAG: hypothetical protein ACREFQ_15350 [Stellaceae bacterium]
MPRDMIYAGERRRIDYVKLAAVTAALMGSWALVYAVARTMLALV